ncbi:GNAT family N-acetyltransferase [Clostridium sp.]|uniref:GNAT family N-acetyltransferase n=1 Tax=Clostridium sp. TaxID=1506 RepID=UPI003D6D276C
MRIVGFYSLFFECGIMNIGLGLKPALTGRRIGAEFVISGINFGVGKFNYNQNCIMLAVASFNKRAIKVNEKLGFQYIEKYMQKTNGGEFEFIKI